MGHNGGLIDNTVRMLADVKAVLSESVNILSGLCKSDKINMWAKHKPVSGTPPSGTGGNYGIEYTSYSSLANAKAACDNGTLVWRRIKPTSSFRLHDFAGYDHDSPPPCFDIGGSIYYNNRNWDIPLAASIQSNEYVSLADIAGIADKYLTVFIYATNGTTILYAWSSDYPIGNSGGNGFNILIDQYTILISAAKGYSMYAMLTDNQRKDYRPSSTTGFGSFIPLPCNWQGKAMPAKEFEVSGSSAQVHLEAWTVDNMNVNITVEMYGAGRVAGEIVMRLKTKQEGDPYDSTDKRYQMQSATSYWTAVDHGDEQWWAYSQVITLTMDSGKTPEDYMVWFVSSSSYGTVYTNIGYSIPTAYGIKIQRNGSDASMTSISADVGDTFQFGYRLIPEGSVDDVVWSVVAVGDAANAVTVDQNGFVRVIASTDGIPAYVMVALTGNSDISDFVSINTGSAPSSTTVTITDYKASMTVGDTYTWKASVTPSGSLYTWSSSDSSKASVNVNGVVTANAAGSVRIYCTADEGGGQDYKDIEIKSSGGGGETETPDIDIPSALEIKANETGTLTATVSGTTANVSWSSSKTGIAVVQSTSGTQNTEATIKGVAAGTSVITASITVNGVTYSDTCTVTVKPSGGTDVSVTGVTLNTTALSLSAGGTATLTATVSPSNATNKSVTWKSSDTSVCEVNASGKVTAVSTGTAYVTVTTVDGGKTASCKVTVNVPVTSVSVSPTSITIGPNAEKTLTATVYPSNATNKAVIWKSSNTDIATVEDGVVKGVRTGTCTVTVTTVDGKKTADCEVTVEANVGVALTAEHYSSANLVVKCSVMVYGNGRPSSTGRLMLRLKANGQGTSIQSGEQYKDIDFSGATQVTTSDGQIGYKVSNVKFTVPSDFDDEAYKVTFYVIGYPYTEGNIAYDV